MLKQKTWLGIFFNMIFSHMVAQWSEKARFFMSKNSIEQPWFTLTLPSPEG